MNDALRLQGIEKSSHRLPIDQVHSACSRSGSAEKVVMADADHFATKVTRKRNYARTKQSTDTGDDDHRFISTSMPTSDPSSVASPAVARH